MKNNKKTNQGLGKGLPAKITKLINSESDRGVILILSAYLEEICGDVIRASCVSGDEADKILDLRQPGGDFASKISIGTAFGLIHSSEAKALNIIRKVRNSAAHFDKSGSGFDVLFDADKTIDQVANLAEIMELSKPDRTKESVRESFIACSRSLAVQILFRAMEAERKTPKPPRLMKDVIEEHNAQMKMSSAIETLDIEGFIRDNKFESEAEEKKALVEYIKKKFEEKRLRENELRFVGPQFTNTEFKYLRY